MAETSFKNLIFHGSEERNLEYKSSISWSQPATKAKVIIGCLAMANIPDGGIIIFGVDQPI